MRHEATPESVQGARRLAFELRNHGVDRVAASHFAAEDRQRESSEAAARRRSQDIAKEFQGIVVAPHNLKTALRYTTAYRENEDGTKTPYPVKIETTFKDGQITAETATPL